MEKVYSLEKDLNYCNMPKPHFDFFTKHVHCKEKLVKKKGGLTINILVYSKILRIFKLWKPDAAISKSKKSKY